MRRVSKPGGVIGSQSSPEKKQVFHKAAGGAPTPTVNQRNVKESPRHLKDYHNELHEQEEEEKEKNEKETISSEGGP